MRDHEPTDADELWLERYLSGILSESETETLLICLARSASLRDRLEAVRSRNLPVTPLRRALAGAEAAAPPAPPLADALLTPTPPGSSAPYTIGRIRGGRQRVMGPADDSDTFGPTSTIEIELHPDDRLVDHLPVALLIADDDERLHRSGLTASIDDDVIVFAGKGRDAFPFSGRWTLCLLVGVSDPASVGARSLGELRAVMPPTALLTRSIHYDAG